MPADEPVAGPLNVASGTPRTVLDLRDAAWGDAADAVAVAELFMNGGPVTTRVGRRVSETVLEADAARSASIARTSTEAKKDAKDAAQASLANQQIHCLSVNVSVDTADFSKPVGESGSVAVTVECLLDLSDLSVPGVPGSRVIKATISSPLDTWRERA